MHQVGLQTAAYMDLPRMGWARGEGRGSRSIRRLEPRIQRLAGPVLAHPTRVSSGV
jgi:hypothetical protein